MISDPSNGKVVTLAKFLELLMYETFHTEVTFKSSSFLFEFTPQINVTSLNPLHTLQGKIFRLHIKNYCTLCNLFERR